MTTQEHGWSLETLAARQAIHDCLMRYCWGVDRGDLGLILSAFHPDARDNHSGVEESAVERFTRTVVEGSAMHTSHNLGNILIQVDGDKAAAQSYFTAWHQFEFDSQGWDWVIGGRYVDRFACRTGQWRIVHRTVVYDLQRFDGPGAIPANHPATDFFDRVIRGQRGKSDFSYDVMDAAAVYGLSG